MREDKRRAVGLANPFPVFHYLGIGHTPEKKKRELYLQYQEPTHAQLRKSMHPIQDIRLELPKE
jgi:hypothetical protein